MKVCRVWMLLSLLSLAACSSEAPPPPKVAHKPIVISDAYKDTVRRQLGFCQLSTPMPKDAENRNDLIVGLTLQLNHEGELNNMYVSEAALRKAKSDPVYRDYVLSSIAAFKRCLPFYNLPKDKYASWREMRLTFDRGRMLF